MKHTLYIIILILTDLSGFYISLGLAYLTRLGLASMMPSIPALITSMEFFLIQLWIPLVLLLTLSYEGLYSKRASFWMETKTITKSVLLTSVIVLSILTLAKMTHEVSRLFVLLLFFYGLFIIPLCRFHIKKSLHCRGFGIERIILIGSDERALNIAQVFDGDLFAGFRIACFIGDHRGNVRIHNREIQIYRGIKWLNRLSAVLSVSAVVVTLRQEDIKKILPEIQRKVKHVFLVPDIEGIGLLNTELVPLFEGDLPLLYVKNNLKDPINIFIKNLFDLTLALLILPVIFPMLIILSLIIKIDSRGPVLFTQKRVGRGGEEFTLYKFRTMFLEADKILQEHLQRNPDLATEFYSYCKLKEDPRVTRVGKVLRKCSFDELPQIFNILKGDMSFVGPRPAFRHEIEQYYGDSAHSYIEVKPGITGLWQVSGRNKLTMKDRARLEGFYVTNWSLWFDIVILLKTIKVVLKREGAY